MSTEAPATAAKGEKKTLPSRLWKGLVPILVVAVLLPLPPPNGLEQYAWLYFAIFAGVIVGLILEPQPGGAIET